MSPFVNHLYAGTNLFGITGLTTPGEAVSDTWRQGWQFTVGAEPLTVKALRHYASNLSASGGSYRVIVHRVSDGVVMVQADIAVVASDEGWVETAVADTVLAASTAYTVSARPVGTSDDVYRNPTGITMSSDLTMTNDGVYSTSGAVDTLPTGTSTHDRRPMADIKYTVGGAAPSGTQEWGVTAVTINTTAFLASTDFRLGRRFTVGATALNLNKLRVYVKEVGTYRVIVHRDSDDVVMAQADIIAGAGNAWAEASVTPATLAISTNYTISARVISPVTADVYRNPITGTLTYNSAHTHDSYRYSASATDARPLTSVTATYYWADIGFLT